MINCEKTKSVFFEDLLSIDIDNYTKETDLIKNKIDMENNKIEQYNIIVNNTIEKIKKLEKWDDFVEFENKKYGINDTHNLIHREKDCFGFMIKQKDYYQGCYCHRCEDWGGCGNGGTWNKVYKCDKCNYIKNL
jgi:hypothetical protein